MDFKNGDRVKVTYEGTVIYAGSDELNVKTLNGQTLYLETSETKFGDDVSVKLVQLTEIEQFDALPIGASFGWASYNVSQAGWLVKVDDDKYFSPTNLLNTGRGIITRDEVGKIPRESTRKIQVKVD